MMQLKCCTQYVSKFGKLSSGHRTGKCQFTFQSQRMFKLPNNCTHFACQQGNAQNPSSQASAVHEPRISVVETGFASISGISINGVDYSVAGSSDLDITAQEIAAYFEEYCTVEASVDGNILDLTNVDLENETNYTALDFNSSNVSAGNKILEIN